MAVDNSKFSNFADGGDLLEDDIVVGLRSGANTKFVYSGTLPPGTIIPIANGGTQADNASDARDNLGLQIGADVEAYSAVLDGLADLASTGLVAQTASATFTNRTITGTANQVIVSNGDGVSGNPTLTLPQSIATTSSPTFANPIVTNLLNGYTTTATAAGTTVLTVSSTYMQYFTGSTTQTVTLPVTSTLALGQSFRIVNNSTGVVTINSSGANLVFSLKPSSVVTVTCILTSGTSAASWSTTGSLSITASAVLVSNSSAVSLWSSSMTNGQLIVGSTGGTPVAATLTAGAGISITNGSGSITIAGTGSGIGWTEVTGTSQLMTADSGWIANNASLVTLTLPTAAAVGTAISVVGKGAGGWLIAQNANQIIRISSANTTTGATGTLASDNRYDSINLICTTADTVWTALGAPQSRGLTIV